MKHAEVDSPTMLPGDSLVPLESILFTEELNRRPSRPPDYEADKCALVALAQALADSPRTILRTMAEKMLGIFDCDSAGFSLLTKDRKNFYWPAIAGMWQPHIGGGTPRNFGPCGDVLDCNRPLLFSHWERRYPYLLAAMPAAEEGLLVPFYVEGRAVGTIWVIAHNDRRKFDAEDMRQLVSLGSFASSAYQVVAFLEALEERDEALRQSCEELEQRVSERTVALRDSEEQWKAAFESNPVMYFMADGTGKTLSVNAFGADGLGYKQSELVGQSILNVFYEADREQVRKDVENCFQNLGRTFTWEARKVRKDGTVIWVRETANALLLKNRPVLLVVCEDITDRKRAEEAARRSERQLRDVFETIPAMAWSALPDGRVDFMNRAWRDYTGLSMDKALGLKSADIIHPDDQAAIIGEWESAMKNGQPLETEVRLRREDGEYRSWFVRNVPLRDEHGNIVKWYGTAIDVEARKQAEKALRASEQLARSHVEVMMRSLDVLATEAAPEKFVAEMLRTIGQRLDAHSVSLWLRNQEDDSLRLRLMIKDDQQVALDRDHPFMKDPRAWTRSPPFQEMVFMKGPVVCDDIERDPRIGAELREYLMSRGRKRFLAVPMFVLGEVRGFIGIEHGERGTYRPQEIELAQALAHHVMIAAHETELNEQRRHAVILKERTRMARDIHDTLAQGFTGIILQLEALANAISRRKPQKVKKCLQRARDLARRSLNEARRSVHALRPEALEHVNFWEALKGLIKNTAAATPIRTKSRLRGKLPKLRLDWQEDLMHIGQEALTNALKYAHADTFETRLVCHAKKLRLEFQDDGDGFNIKDQHDGVGLTGMRERVARMGGELSITSARSKGTKITVVLPCNGKSVS